MKDYILYDPESGEITRSGSCQDEAFDSQHQVGLVLIGGAGTYETHHIVGGEVIEYTVAQSALKAKRNLKATWSNQAMGWVDKRPISELISEKNAQINAGRRTANQASFTFAGHPIACDPVSRVDIESVTAEITLTGDLPLGWSGTWKASDNTTVPIPTKVEWVALYKAMTARSRANFAHAQTLKATLGAAQTREEIDAITLDFE